MTARLRAVTEATELEVLRTVASALVTGSRPRARLNNVIRVGLERALAEVDRAMTEVHSAESLGARPGRQSRDLYDRVRRRIERAFMAVLMDATRLYDRLSRRDLTPEQMQVELDHAARLREGCRVNVQGRWWSLTTYTQTVLGSGCKRSGVWGTVDRG